MGRPYRIDTHQHIVPPGYARWMLEKGIRPGGIGLPSWSERSALKFMDRHDVQTGILSLSTPGVYFGDAAEARRRAREISEYSAEVVAARPERFGFFATLTLPDVQGALAEAQYALDILLADGVVLLANNAGRYLGDPGFEPLLEFLHHRRAVVFVHPADGHTRLCRRFHARHDPHRYQPDPVRCDGKVLGNQVHPGPRGRLRALHRLQDPADDAQR